MVSLDTLLLSERQKLLHTIDTLTVEISIRPKGSLVTKKVDEAHTCTSSTGKRKK